MLIVVSGYFADFVQTSKIKDRWKMLNLLRNFLLIDHNAYNKSQIIKKWFIQKKIIYKNKNRHFMWLTTTGRGLS